MRSLFFAALAALSISAQSLDLERPEIREACREVQEDLAQLDLKGVTIRVEKDPSERGQCLVRVDCPYPIDPLLLAMGLKAQIIGAFATPSRGFGRVVSVPWSRVIMTFRDVREHLVITMPARYALLLATVLRHDQPEFWLLAGMMPWEERWERVKERGPLHQ